MKVFPNLGNLIPIVGDDTQVLLLMNILKTIIWILENSTVILQILPLLKNQLEFALDGMF